MVDLTVEQDAHRSTFWLFCWYFPTTFSAASTDRALPYYQRGRESSFGCYFVHRLFRQYCTFLHMSPFGNIDGVPTHFVVRSKLNFQHSGFESSLRFCWATYWDGLLQLAYRVCNLKLTFLYTYAGVQRVSISMIWWQKKKYFWWSSCLDMSKPGQKLGFLIKTIFWYFAKWCCAQADKNLPDLGEFWKPFNIKWIWAFEQISSWEFRFVVVFEKFFWT